MINRAAIACVAVLIATEAHCLLGQATQGKALKDRAGEVSQQIGSDDAAQVALGCQGIRAMLEAGENPSNLRAAWLPLLVKKGRHEDVAEFALKVMLLVPDAKTTLSMMEMRVRALLALKRPQEALVTAKVAFNVCLILETEKALDLLCECMTAMHPNDPQLVRRFKMELVGVSARLWAEPAAGSAGGTLKGIKIEGTVLAEINKALAVWKEKKDKFGDRMNYANLLLAADRAEEAEEAFRVLYKTETEAKNRALAGEAIARALKAQDGSMAVSGRANRWLEEMNKGGVAVRMDKNAP